jgi:hypothetical protein
MKGAEATTLYGCEARNGALIVTLKKRPRYRVVVKDFFDKELVPYATATLIFPGTNDTLRFIGDENGVIVVDNKRELSGSKMIVSAVGYETLTRPVDSRELGAQREIFLSKDIKVCDEVVLMTYQTVRCGRTISCKCSSQTSQCGTWFICGVSGTIFKADTTQERKRVAVTGFNVYPNPVSRGSQVNLRFNNSGPTGNVNIRVLSSGGAVAYLKPAEMQKGSNYFPLQTDSRWAAGIYFVQLVYENGQVAASGRVVVQ